MTNPVRRGYVAPVTEGVLRRKSVCLAALASALLFAPLVQAQETPGERLFRDGREALERNELDLACSKFKESYQLEKALGPLLNHANCEENRGRLVGARSLWTEVAARTEAGSEEHRVAEQRLAALDTTVPRLTIELAPGTPAETTVELDGVRIKLDGGPVLVDPGAHVVVARHGALEDRKPIQAVRGQTHAVTLRIEAAIASAPEPATPVPEPTPAESGPSGGWIAGWVVGGVGVASLIGFGATGGVLLSESSEWETNGCKGSTPTGPCEKPDGLLVANAVLLGVGAVGVGVGIILLATQESSRSNVAVVAGPGDVGLGVRARF